MYLVLHDFGNFTTLYLSMYSQLNNNSNVASLHRRHSEGKIVEPPCATTSRKRPPPMSNGQSNTAKVSQSKPYSWNL